MPGVHTGDIETYYEDTGQGPCVVLVHAATLDLTSWEGQVDALSADHRVIAYDLRGHGRTANPGNRPYTVDTLADDLRSMLDALDVDRPILCGLSLGAMVAQTYASRNPATLSGLVLAGASSPPILSFSERLQRAVLPRVMIGQARMVGYERLKRILIWVQTRVHGKDAMGTVQAASLPPMTTRDFASAVRCFATFHKVAVDLSAIDVPTLILHGDNEPAFIHRHADRLREHIPQASVLVIEGAGHASNLDQPEAFSEALRSFAAQVAASGGPSSKGG